MDLTTPLLAATREADVERHARARRLTALVETCRRWLFGIVPITQSCDSCCA